MAGAFGGRLLRRWRQREVWVADGIYSDIMLSWTPIEYEKEIASVMQLEHLRSSVRWGADFILRAHVSPTTLYTQVCVIVSSFVYFLIYLYIVLVLR